MNTTLAYQISRDLSNLYCELHHMSLSSRNAKELTVVKVCCSHFKGEVEQELERKFGAEFVKEHIRFQLPVTEFSATTAINFTEE